MENYDPVKYFTDKEEKFKKLFEILNLEEFYGQDYKSYWFDFLNSKGLRIWNMETSDSIAFFALCNNKTQIIEPFLGHTNMIDLKIQIAYCLEHDIPIPNFDYHNLLENRDEKEYFRIMNRMYENANQLFK